MEVSLTEFALVMLGGGLGSMARAALSGVLIRQMPAAAAVFIINATGSLMIGLALGAALGAISLLNSAEVPLGFTYFAVGLMGGFTTVSTFALQVQELWHAGKRLGAIATALGSTLICPALAALGVFLVMLVRGLV
ncbi:MAG: hypothetical protein EA407_06020 [Rhodobacteraceae bacterium]|nr:MAG: hypothetical protein EA407_06020 [Paracoccaceae bacterium]